MTRILAFDPATTTGWCIGTEPDALYIQSFMVGNRDATKLHEYLSRIRHMVSMFEPSVVAYEDPYVASYRSARLQYGFTGIIEACTPTLADIMVVHPSAVKKRAVGKGRASKEEILEAARKHYPSIKNHDEADAYWVWILAYDQVQETSRTC